MSCHKKDLITIFQHKMPPRKATKRTAPTPDAGAQKPEQKKKKIEVKVKPNLRNLDTSGVILTVGQGDVGQLGLGQDIIEKKRPTVIPEYTDVIAIAAGGMHNVCLLESGRIITFGCNDEGALGRDTSEEGSECIPNFVDLEPTVVQITAGDSHSAALLRDGRVFAWGAFRDSHGSMGLSIKGSEHKPIEMMPGVKVVKIASGADHLVMLTEGGRIYTCGGAEQGQLGRISARFSDRYSRRGVGHLLKPHPVTFKKSNKLLFDDIWAGQWCTFARDAHEGHIYVCGLNNFYQIGLSDNMNLQYHLTKSEVFSLDECLLHISSGQHHTLALKRHAHHGDTAYVIGRKEYGRLGLGPDCKDARSLMLIEALKSENIIDIAAGNAQSFAVTKDGKLFAWGMGSSCQLGTGQEEDVDVPVLIKCRSLLGKKVVRVAAGGQHTLILAVNCQENNND